MRGPHFTDLSRPMSRSTCLRTVRSSAGWSSVSTSRAMLMNSGCSFSPQGSVLCSEDLFVIFRPRPSSRPIALRQFSRLLPRFEPIPRYTVGITEADFLQRLFNPLDGLFCPLDRHGERKPNITFPGCAEAVAGSGQYAGSFEQMGR